VDLFAFWAKLPREEKPPRHYHPVLCHLIDVAVVTEALWRTVLTEATRLRVARQLGMGEQETGFWISFLAGSHDIGKVSPAFQFQVSDPEVRVRLRSAGFGESSLRQPLENTPHGTISTIALREEILNATPYSLKPLVLRSLATLVGGHHGQFPRPDTVDAVPSASVGGTAWRQARREMMAALAGLLEVPLAVAPQEMDHPVAMFLAGLISVADWIGSASEYFPFASQDAGTPSLDSGKYLAHARRQARDALARLGWTGWTPSTARLSFPALFGGKEPRGVQHQAIALAEDVPAPALVVIEAPMGEGKTEAAMYLADRWGMYQGQAGCYFALPTQATSNQMFGRVRDFLSTRYPEDVVNVQLVHGHAALSAELQELLKRHEILQLQGIYDADKQGAVVAAEWFTYRKRGLLAPFGVGTVDQALLAVLQTKHVFVRHFGLAPKTVIIDEVHAYDTYMTTLLERLLEWLAALATPVILLSATLPAERRQALLGAYARGLNVPDPAPAPEQYPRITWIARGTRGTSHVPAAASRTLRLEWLAGGLPDEPGAPFLLGERLQAALADGGCAAFICNTVGRAQQVYEALRTYFPGLADDGYPVLDLFHARYRFKERDERERRALLRFGRAGARVEMRDGSEREVCRPKRAILVATQVIEQSLDLDFDLMVTDMAPVDLLLQRSGRTWRHDRIWRPAWLEGVPALWICRPGVTEAGVPTFDTGTSYIYDQHVLLRSWLTLSPRSTVVLPTQMDELIEAVYATKEAPADLAAAVRAAWQDSEVKYREGHDSDARQAVDCCLGQPLDTDTALWQFTANLQKEDAPDLHPVHQALTRLAEPTVQVILLTQEEAKREATALVGSKPPGGAAVQALLEHSVTLNSRLVVKSLLAKDPPEAWKESALLQHYRLLRLDGDRQVGENGYTIRLDPDLGIVISRVKKVEGEE
jgi:CRISPR-associated endonuclease/helicase Cas3